jgi:hypothetical protein
MSYEKGIQELASETKIISVVPAKQLSPPKQTVRMVLLLLG